jgi:hypothetical protein
LVCENLEAKADANNADPNCPDQGTVEDFPYDCDYCEPGVASPGLDCSYSIVNGVVVTARWVWKPPYAPRTFGVEEIPNCVWIPASDGTHAGDCCSGTGVV